MSNLGNICYRTKAPGRCKSESTFQKGSRALDPLQQSKESGNVRERHETGNLVSSWGGRQDQVFTKKRKKIRGTTLKKENLPSVKERDWHPV